MGANGRLKKQIRKQAAPPQEGAMQGQGGTLGTAAQMADPNKSGQMEQAKIRQVEDVTAMYMNLIHSEDTRDSIMQTLKSQQNPAKAVSATANMLFKRVDAQTQKRRTKIPNDVKIAAAQYVVVDLVNLGNASGAWEQPIPESEVPGIFQKVVQDYLHQAIRNKTIDTTELQRDIESLMTDDQKATGVKLGQSSGVDIPPGPTPTMAVDRQVEQAVGKEQAKTQQARAQAEALKGNIRQASGTKHQAEQTEAAAQQPPV